MNKYCILIFFTAFCSAMSQILLNLSNQKKHRNKIKEYMNFYVILSYIILAFVLIANIYIMQFVQLKIAHALSASTYIFAMFLSALVLHEKITVKKMIGNSLILAGIYIFVT